MPRHKIKLVDARGSAVRDLLPAEAQRMLARGSVIEDRGRCGERVVRQVETHHQGPPVSQSDAATITMGDIVAAYANGGGRDRRGNYERARIAVWPDVHDTKAVCMTARR